MKSRPAYGGCVISPDGADAEVWRSDICAQARRDCFA